MQQGNRKKQTTTTKLRPLPLHQCHLIGQKTHSKQTHYTALEDHRPIQPDTFSSFFNAVLKFHKKQPVPVFHLKSQ